MSSTAKRKALTVEEKFVVLKKVYDEEYPAKTQKQLADEFGIPSSILRPILKNRSKIVEVVGGCKRQKLRADQYEDLEQVLLERFHQARATNLPTCLLVAPSSRRRPSKLLVVFLLRTSLRPAVGLIDFERGMA